MYEASRCASNSDESHKSECNGDNKELNILTKCTVLSNVGLRDIDRMGTYSLSDLA